tara:strand:- start:486 stop:701 length:216 start_codon:yes stop_codon:yes gene_type:complete
MKHQKVEGRTDIVRDKVSGAVLYTKSEQQVQAIRARKKAQKQKEQDVDQLKEDVSELKGMMKLILEKLDGA